MIPEANLGDDQQLMEQCQQGDDSAFEQLFQKYGRRVYAIAYRFTSDPQEAEDILQTTFLRAYEHIVGHRRIQSFYPWLCRVAVNLATDYHRASRPQEQVETVNLSSHSVWANPERTVENRELGEKINAAIEQLSSRQREVFLLKTVTGLPHKEIADILGCSHAAVRANLYQAVGKLRESLRKYIRLEGEASNEM